MHSNAARWMTKLMILLLFYFAPLVKSIKNQCQIQTSSSIISSFPKNIQLSQNETRRITLDNYIQGQNLSATLKGKYDSQAITLNKVYEQREEFDLSKILPAKNIDKQNFYWDDTSMDLTQENWSNESMIVYLKGESLNSYTLIAGTLQNLNSGNKSLYYSISIANDSLKECHSITQVGIFQYYIDCWTQNGTTIHDYFIYVNLQEKDYGLKWILTDSNMTAKIGVSLLRKIQTVKTQFGQIILRYYLGNHAEQQLSTGIEIWNVTNPTKQPLIQEVLDGDSHSFLRQIYEVKATHESLFVVSYDSTVYLVQNWILGEIQPDKIYDFALNQPLTTDFKTVYNTDFKPLTYLILAGKSSNKVPIYIISSTGSYKQFQVPLPSQSNSDFGLYDIALTHHNLIISYNVGLKALSSKCYYTVIFALNQKPKTSLSIFQKDEGSYDTYIKPISFGISNFYTSIQFDTKAVTIELFRPQLLITNLTKSQSFSLSYSIKSIPLTMTLINSDDKSITLVNTQSSVISDNLKFQFDPNLFFCGPILKIHNITLVQNGTVAKLLQFFQNHKVQFEKVSGLDLKDFLGSSLMLDLLPLINSRGIPITDNITPTLKFKYFQQNKKEQKNLVNFGSISLADIYQTETFTINSTATFLDDYFDQYFAAFGYDIFLFNENSNKGQYIKIQKISQDVNDVGLKVQDFGQINLTNATGQKNGCSNIKLFGIDTRKIFLFCLIPEDKQLFNITLELMFNQEFEIVYKQDILQYDILDLPKTVTTDVPCFEDKMKQKNIDIVVNFPYQDDNENDISNFSLQSDENKIIDFSVENEQLNMAYLLTEKQIILIKCKNLGASMDLIPGFYYSKIQFQQNEVTSNLKIYPFLDQIYIVSLEKNTIQVWDVSNFDNPYFMRELELCPGKTILDPSKYSSNNQFPFSINTQNFYILCKTQENQISLNVIRQGQGNSFLVDIIDVTSPSNMEYQEQQATSYNEEVTNLKEDKDSLLSVDDNDSSDLVEEQKVQINSKINNTFDELSINLSLIETFDQYLGDLLALQLNNEPQIIQIYSGTLASDTLVQKSAFRENLSKPSISQNENITITIDNQVAGGEGKKSKEFNLSLNLFTKQHSIQVIPPPELHTNKLSFDFNLQKYFYGTIYNIRSSTNMLELESLCQKQNNNSIKFSNFPVNSTIYSIHLSDKNIFVLSKQHLLIMNKSNQTLEKVFNLDDHLGRSICYKFYIDKYQKIGIAQCSNNQIFNQVQPFKFDSEAESCSAIVVNPYKSILVDSQQRGGSDGMLFILLQDQSVNIIEIYLLDKDGCVSPSVYSSIPTWVLGSNQVNVTHFDFNSSESLLIFLSDQQYGIDVISFDYNTNMSRLMFQQSFEKLLGVYYQPPQKDNNLQDNYIPAGIEIIDNKCVGQECSFMVAFIGQNFNSQFLTFNIQGSTRLEPNSTEFLLPSDYKIFDWQYSQGYLMLIGINQSYFGSQSADILFYNISTDADYMINQIDDSDQKSYKSILWRYPLIKNFSTVYKTQVLFVQQPLVFLESCTKENPCQNRSESQDSKLFFPDFVNKSIHSFNIQDKMELEWKPNLATYVTNRFYLLIENNFQSVEWYLDFNINEEVFMNIWEVVAMPFILSVLIILIMNCVIKDKTPERKIIFSRKKQKDPLSSLADSPFENQYLNSNNNSDPLNQLAWES